MGALVIKDFPDDLHKQAKAKAALMGIPLKDLIIQAVSELVSKEHPKKGAKDDDVLRT